VWPKFRHKLCKLAAQAKKRDEPEERHLRLSDGLKRGGCTPMGMLPARGGLLRGRLHG